jgi:hypothetical protein
MKEKVLLWAKYILAVIAVLAIVGLLIVVKYQHDELDRSAALQQNLAEVKQLGDGIIRAQSSYVTKEDLEKILAANKVDISPIKKDLEDLDAKLKSVSTVTVITPGSTQQNIPSTDTRPRTDASVNVSNDPYGYLRNSQILSLNEPLANGTQVPFGQTQFNAWEPKPWTLNIYPRKYSVTTVTGEDEDGKQYTYHKFNIDTQGKSYPIIISDAKFVQEYPEASFKFNPKLFLGLDVGTYIHPALAAEVMPNLQLSLFSYGQSKHNPTWTFLGLGLGYMSQAQNLGVMISPFMFNIGEPLPLVENLYVGPTVAVNTSGGFAIMGGIKVGL